ncbi:kinase-like domain-containing protein [Podospora australis]|uniref:Kinase-like domain-containing protein n=1 Tax=Podospora australis TaxID=1536484 RepID=A0AAN7ANU0_9PEZI|nr:kinase-like domain-containing protein [Podospora australis]
MAAFNPDSQTLHVVEEIQKELSKTEFACSSLVALTGGLANFVFKGRLVHSLPDGTREVAVKHGEDFVAGMPEWKITTDRCHIEQQCLRAVDAMPSTTSAPCVVRTPKFHVFNEKTNTQVQELLHNTISLKDYALKYFSTPSSDPLRKRLCSNIGESLGIWLRDFHSWSTQSEQSSLRSTLESNKSIQNLRHKANYTNLLADVDTYSDILGDAKDIFVQLEKLAAEELKRPNLDVIHGDFWTGNALLADEPPAPEALHPAMFIVDWEMAQLNVRPLDLGQMIAELYELFLFKGIQEGKWLMEGFTTGYGYSGDEFAFRVALQVGGHLIVWGSRAPGWGTTEQVLEVIGKGKEIIAHAWHKDRAWFEAGDLACLFTKP